MKREEESREGEARTTRVLPNGLMSIATPSVCGCQEEGGSVDRKVGFEDGCLLTRRCIWSKNVEPIPVATIKNIPYGRGSGMGRKRICHSCKEKNVVKMVRCLSCMKRISYYGGGTQPLNYVHETVLKKRKISEDWAIKRRELLAEKKRSKKERFKGAIPEEFVKEHRNKANKGPWTQLDHSKLRSKLGLNEKIKSGAILTVHVRFEEM